MIGNEIGRLLKYVKLYRQYINMSETKHFWRIKVAATMMKILCKNLDSIKSYDDKTNMKVFELSLWEISAGLNLL